MSEFRLDPWEKTIQFSGYAEQPEFENADLHLACVPVRPNRWIMFGYEKARPESGNWLALLLALEPRTWSSEMPFWVPQKASEIWSSYRKCRLFSWADKRCILEEDGVGAWLDEELNIEVEFKMNFSSDTWNHSALLWESVQQELALPDSDIGFKFRWQAATWEEKQDMHFAGRTVELQEVAKWILVEIACHYESRYLSWSVSPSYAEDTDFDCENYWDQIKEELEPWQQFFVRDFLPPILQAQRQLYRGLDAEQIRGYCVFSAFIHSTPSAHERLEARLLMREWLERNAPGRMDLSP